MRDRMVEPDLDQPLRHRHRDEPLRGLPRHAELLGDLVLGVAGDVIEPAGARRIVEAVAVRLDLERLAARAVNDVLHDNQPARCGRRPPADSPATLIAQKRRRHRIHAVEHRNTGFNVGRRPPAPSLKWLPPTKRQTVIPAFCPPARRPRCPRSPGISPASAPKALRRVKKEVRRRLAARHHGSAEYPALEERQQPGQLQRQGGALEAAAGRHAIGGGERSRSVPSTPAIAASSPR